MRTTFLKRSLFVLFLIVVCLGVKDGVAFAGDNNYVVQDKSYEELNKMEILANDARVLYWNGEYQKALDIFDTLARSNHPNTPLYFDEIAQCQIALGKLSEAEKSLRNVDNFFRTYNTEDRERKALSSFGKEADKIYLGDPYERASNYLLLAVIFMNRGDYENALAACKSGILAAADVGDNKNSGNYTMLHLLEMKNFQMLGRTDTAAQSRAIARRSYINAHPMVRDLYSDRLGLLELLSLSQEQRKKLNVKETQEELQAKLKDVEDKLTEASRRVNPEEDLGILLTGDYNTLIVVPVGKGPHKSRKGKDGQVVVIEPDQSTYQKPAVYIDGTLASIKPVTQVADINFLAMTRGGRKMDAILQGKAVYRSTTVGAGALLTDIGNRLGGIAGLATVFVGLIAQGVGGAMSPEADTRCWQLLPSSFDVYALNLPAGEHEIDIKDRIYFEIQSETARKISINGQGGLAIVLSPPVPVGRYSENADSETEIRNSVKKAVVENETASILLPPPLGLKQIERFPPLEAGGRPEAVAPDLRKITRKIEKRLATSLQVVKLSHSDILNNIESFSKSLHWALQTEFEHLDLSKDKDDRIYSIDVTFSLVDTASGKAVARETTKGIYRKTADDKIGSTSAYYKCFDDALNKFLAGKNISKIVTKPFQKAAL